MSLKLRADQATSIKKRPDSSPSSSSASSVHSRWVTRITLVVHHERVEAHRLTLRRRLTGLPCLEASSSPNGTDGSMSPQGPLRHLGLAASTSPRWPPSACRGATCLAPTVRGAVLVGGETGGGRPGRARSGPSGAIPGDLVVARRPRSSIRSCVHETAGERGVSFPAGTIVRSFAYVEESEPAGPWRQRVDGESVVAAPPKTPRGRAVGATGASSPALLGHASRSRETPRRRGPSSDRWSASTPACRDPESTLCTGRGFDGTSQPRRPTGPGWPGWPGTTRTCPGTPPSFGSDRWLAGTRTRPSRVRSESVPNLLDVASVDQPVWLDADTLAIRGRPARWWQPWLMALGATILLRIDRPRGRFRGVCVGSRSAHHRGPRGPGPGSPVVWRSGGRRPRRNLADLTGVLSRTDPALRHRHRRWVAHGGGLAWLGQHALRRPCGVWWCGLGATRWTKPRRSR